ncbi:MAG: metallophosphoesterase [Calditrichales bacterium]|nr:metallophosphoesterase [Calditrichales bacterium]
MKKIYIILIIICITAVYAFFIEPQRLIVTTVEIKSDAFADILENKTVVHLSDLHFKDGKNPLLNKILKRLENIKPDLIFLSGDYVDWFSGSEAYDHAEYFLSQLKAAYGVYAVMGDADYTCAFRHCLFCHTENSVQPPVKHSVHFLRDTNKVIQIDDHQLNIAGLNVNINLSANIQFMHSLIDSLPTIFLSHTSMPYDKLDADKNVFMLCGDTHGGQVYLPIWLWKILKRKIDPKHMYGYFHEKNKHLFVNSGIGVSFINIRFGVPPEIVLLKFIHTDGE